MPKVDTLQTAFNNGAITPRLRAHVDLQKYFSSLAQAVNLVVLKHGGAQRRSGFRFVKPTKFNTGNIRLKEFEVNILQAYLIEIGLLYFRFYSLQGQVQDGPGPSETVHPYIDSAIPELDFTQSADVLFITHEDFPPAKLTRTTPETFAYEELELIDGPFLEENSDTTKTIAVSGTGINRTLTAVGHTPFTLITDVKRLFRVNMKITGTPQWISFKITAVTSTSIVQADIQLEDPATVTTVTTKQFRIGAWSDTTTWPAKISFHQGRLFFGGGKGEEAQTINASESDDFTKFSPSNLDGDIVDSNGIRATIDTDQVNAIRWLKSSGALVIGTSGAEFSLTAFDDQILSPSNAKISRETQHGSAEIDPEYIGRDILYVQRAGRKVRELSVDVISGNLESIDTSLWAEHLTVGGITDTAYQQEPDTIVWLVRADGRLLSLTIDKAQNVRGWAEHRVGGTAVKVLSVASIPSAVANRDEPWAIIEREIDSSTVRSVEFLEKEFDFEDIVEDGFFVDSGISYSGVATNTLTGLDHLEGETVQILGNGSVRTDQVVSGGQVTVSGTAVTKAHVGLGYDSFLETLTPEVPATGGTAQGRKQRIHKATVNLLRTVGLEFGHDITDLDRLAFRNTDDNMNEAVPLFTGSKDVAFTAGWDTVGKVFLRQSQPLPFTVLSIVLRMKIEKA